MTRPTISYPVPDATRTEVTGWLGEALARVVCAKASNGKYPTAEWIRWIAWETARCRRVVGVKSRTQLIHELRRRAQIDTPRPPVAGLSRDDVAHIERVAIDLLPDPF